MEFGEFDVDVVCVRGGRAATLANERRETERGVR